MSVSGSDRSPAEVLRTVRAVLAAVLGVGGAQPGAPVAQDAFPAWTPERHLAIIASLQEVFDTRFSADEMIAMVSEAEIVALLQRRASTASADDDTARQDVDAAYASTSVSSLLSAPSAGPAYAAGLPNRLQDYARNPRQTLSKMIEWLGARWQLRSCQQVGRWTRVIGRMTVDNWGTIIIGERVQIYSHRARTVLTVYEGGTIRIGDRTFINYGSDIGATGSITIGADCLIGTHVSILDNDFHEVTQRDKVPAPRAVVIADHVWIGDRAIIMPGVTIGEGAVVGAGSVVVRDVPARSVAVGNPARIVKSF
jgi:acetyltransferase-like isoleucine patch superfamily enzyme